MDIAALGFEVDSTQARGAAKALADLNSAAIKAANSAAKLNLMHRGNKGQWRSDAQYAAENRKEVENLAKAYNPLMSAQIAYRNESIQTAAAVKLGVITEQQRTQILAQTKTRLEQAAAASQRFGQAQTVASHHVANLSFQLNDIGMMMASGQSPFMLMIQQGPQVAQIFSQLRQSGQSLGSTLAGAFRMVLNPTTLLTLALIGGTAALAQWGMSALGAERDVKKLADATSDLKNRASDIRNYADLSRKSILELSKDYGSLAFSIRDSAKALTELERSQLRADIITSIKAARKEYGDMGVDLDAIRAKLDALPESMRFDRGASTLSSELLFAERKVNDLAEAMSITRDAAERLSKSFAGLDAARTFEQQLAALRNVRATMSDLNIDAAQLPKEIREAMISWENLNLQIAQSEGSVLAAVRSTDSWAGAMSYVLSYVNAIGQSLSNISGTGISIAAARVEADLLRQGKSLREAGLAAARETARLEGEKRTSELQKQYGLWGKVLGAAETAAKQLEISEQASLDILREQARERERAEAKASSGGGRGGGGAARRAAAELKAAEKGFQSLRELLEKDTLFQFAEYEKRQAQLKSALDKRLVTVQQYQEYEAALRIQYFGTEYQQRQLQYDLELQQLRQALEQQLITRQEYDALMRQRQWEQISQLGQIRDAGTAYELNQMATAFGEAASMAGEYNQKFLKAQRVFAASAALISTYQGAAKALELPFPMNMAAAAKVIAAGLGFVSAIKSGGSSGGGGGKSTSSAASAAAKTEPTRQVLVRLEGDDWLVDMAENIMTQIYDQSKDGRVIVARDRS